MNQAPRNESNKNAPNPAAAQNPHAEIATFGELRRSVVEVTRILYVRKWLFFVPLCVVVSAAFLFSLYIPRRYVATTTFERRDDPVLVNLPKNEGSGAFVTFQRTLVQDITSVDSIIDVVRELNLHGRVGSEEDEKVETRNEEQRIRQLASRVAGGLEVRFLHKSEHLDMIEIGYTATEPEFLTETLNAVRDYYIRTTQQRITDLLFQTKQWFEEEHAKRLAVVEELEDDLIRFRTEHKGLDPLNPDAALPKLAELNADLIELERKGDELRTQMNGRRQFLNDGGSDLPGVLPANLAATLGLKPIQQSPETRRLARSIVDLDERINDLKVSRGMTDRHPEVAAMLEKKELLNEALEKNRQDDASKISINGVTESWSAAALAADSEDPMAAAHARVEMELKIFEGLLESNQAEIGSTRAAIDELEILHRDTLLQRKEFANRMNEVERSRRELLLYQRYADQVGRVLTAENSQRGILFGKIVPAAGGSIPASPRASTVIVLALTIGLATSVTLILISEVFDRTVRTRNQVVRTLGIPILESIGEIVPNAVQRRRLFSRLILVPAVTTALLGTVFVTGSLAYLSLRNRGLYDRAIKVPKSVIDDIVEKSREWVPMATVHTNNSERRADG